MVERQQRGIFSARLLRSIDASEEGNKHMMNAQPLEKRTPKPLTGTAVLLMVLGFFAIVIGANMIMAYDAITTFSGLQSPKPYENGLAFNREIARAKAQSDRQWTADATINTRPDGTTAISVHLTDAKGSPLRGYELTASLNSPTDIRRDHRMILAEGNSGDYMGSSLIERGQWDMAIEARQNGETLYRSLSRIILH